MMAVLLCAGFATRLFPITRDFPKPLLEEAGLVGEVEIVVEDNALVIRAVAPVREGWAEAAREAADRGDDGPLDPYVPTRFDREEWEWGGKLE